jgi:hypothetical protein
VRQIHEMTRGQAKRSVAEFLPNVNTEECFKFVKNINSYVKYMFKLIDPLQKKGGEETGGNYREFANKEDCHYWKDDEDGGGGHEWAAVLY